MNVIDDIKTLTGQKPPEKPVPKGPPPPKKTILVVEDEEQLASVLELRLIDEGFQVIRAGNGEQGLELAMQELPDVIILDLLMPIMNGKEMLNKLRKAPECKNIPVIVLTNAGDIENIRETQFYLDAVDFLIKSNVSLEEIIARVKTHALVNYF